MPSSVPSEPSDAERSADSAGAADAPGGGSSVVDLFAAGREARARADATEIRLLARAWAAVRPEPRASQEERRRLDIQSRSLVAELATTTHVSEWTMTRLLGEADDLCRRFPAVVDALERGHLSRHHVSVIHEEGRAIHDPEARNAYVRAVLERARSLTPGRLKPVARVLADRYAERSLDDRHRAAVEDRRVDMNDLPDGMGQLIFTGPATLVRGIDDRLTKQARTVIDGREQDADGSGNDDDPGAAESAGDSRTFAQVRADLFTDLLLCGSPSLELGAGLGAITATVQVTVPVLRMTGASKEPCVLAGYGPIDTDTARHLAAEAPAWERVLTDPTNGCPLAVDRYRPGKALKRFLRARDEGCRFPGCTRPVWRADVDHTIAAQHGGPTSSCNLAHLCRRHHVLKHASEWTVIQISAGVLVWISPSGRSHTDIPRPVVRFEPEPGVLDRRTLLREPWLYDPDDLHGRPDF